MCRKNRRSKCAALKSRLVITSASATVPDHSARVHHPAGATACARRSWSTGEDGTNSARSASRPSPSGWKRSEEHTSELQSLAYLVCRLLLEKKKNQPQASACHYSLRLA